MIDSKNMLRVDPVPKLLSSENEALRFFVRRDLLNEETGPIKSLWELPETGKILIKQQPDGSWKYPSSRKSGYENENYNLLETYRQLRFLIDQFGMNNAHPAIAMAADYVFSHQSEQGDIRGIFGSQYAPHYTAGLLELLVKAGYFDDKRIEKCYAWFHATRQVDGGWAWPLRTANVSYHDAITQDEPVRSDGSKPFAHALTGFVLRAYAAHPEYRNSEGAWKVGELMKSRFFRPDKYSDRKAADYWLKFQFPFWWVNLLSALDSLSLIGFSREDEAIERGLEWFITNQNDDGLWPTGYGKGKKAKTMNEWVGLAICKVLVRLYD
jgi:hypothetical protein